MRWGISGVAIPRNLPFETDINAAALMRDFPPCFLYAVGKVETIDEYGSAAADKMSDNGDGGHGIFQLTDSWPLNWTDPKVNALYAIDDFLMPAVQRVRQEFGFTGETLVRVTADVYNAGWSQMWAGHLTGDSDWLTTGHDYGRRVLAAYKSLVGGLT